MAKLSRLFKILSAGHPIWLWRLLGQEIGRRFFADELAYGFRIELTQPIAVPTPDIPISIRPLVASDIPAVFDLERPEVSDQEFRHAVVSLLLIDAKLPTCYVGIMPDGRPCCLCWLVQADADDGFRSFFGPGLYPLQSGDVLCENVYTHPSFRDRGLMKFITLSLLERSRQQGARRGIAFISANNLGSLSRSSAIGWERFVTKKIRWRFFRRTITFHAP